MTIARGSIGNCYLGKPTRSLVVLIRDESRTWLRHWSSHHECHADTVLLSKSFEVIAVRYENMLFRHHYHGGRSFTVGPYGSGTDLKVYPTTIPSEEGTPSYTLRRWLRIAVVTDYIGNGSKAVRCG